MKDKSVAKDKPKKKKVWIAVVVVVVLVVAGIARFVGNMTQEVATMSNFIEVEPVQQRDLSDTISLRGTISGESRTNVTSMASAEITAMNVQVGDIVQEGDVLCTLDSAAIEKRIADLERTVSNSQAVEGINNTQLADAVEQAIVDQERQLKSAQVQIEEAQQSYVMAERAYNLNPGDETFPALWSAQRAVDAAKDSYDVVLESTNRAIENARLQVELSRYQNSDSTVQDTLTDLREQLADCEVKAPCGGVVTAVNMSVGDVNAQRATILTIENTSSLKLVATVAEADILKLEEGMKAAVTADATGEEEIAGTVTRVVRVKNQSQGSYDATAGGYSVEITIDSTQLLIGMDAKARIMLKEKGNVLAVPYDLIQYDESGNAFVLVAVGNEDGSATAVRKNIEIGEEVDYYVEIVGGELSEGDMLIYDYSFSIMEGATFAPEQIYSEQSLGMGVEVLAQ